MSIENIRNKLLYCYSKELCYPKVKGKRKNYK